MRAWSRHRPDGTVLSAVTIVNRSTVRCVQSDQGDGMPLVNASSSRRMILRTMRRERSRGSQFMNVPTDLSVVGQRTAVCEDFALAAVPCGRRPDARSVGRAGERRECHAALT